MMLFGKSAAPFLILRLGGCLLLGCLALREVRAQAEGQGAVQGHGVKYEELRSKLTIDSAPPLKPGDQVAGYADMLETVMKSVVTISSKRTMTQFQDLFNDPLFRRFFKDRVPDEQDPQYHPAMPVIGSGVVISSDGYILTNNHVVEDSKSLEVTIGSARRKYAAKLVAADPKSDVALVKVEAKDLPTITIGDSSRLRVGDITFAIGNPFGLEQTVTMGIVSALGRSSAGLVDYADFIQTDAAINRGNSGGALIDAKGRLVGINTAIQGGGMGGGNVGIGFAIPSNMALEMVRKLLEGGGVVRRGFLGVQLESLDPDMAEALGWKEDYGVAVTQVIPKTPAAKAGFEPYDVITSYQGQKAVSPDTLRLTISNTAPDENVKFEVFRAGKKIMLELRLAELPTNLDLLAGEAPDAPAAREFLKGVRIVDLSEANRAENEVAEDVQGVLVEGVNPASPASEAGLEPGMVILDVNRTPVKSVEEALKAREAFEGKKLLLRVSVRGSSNILIVRLQE